MSKSIKERVTEQDWWNSNFITRFPFVYDVLDYVEWNSLSHIKNEGSFPLFEKLKIKSTIEYAKLLNDSNEEARKEYENLRKELELID